MWIRATVPRRTPSASASSSNPNPMASASYAKLVVKMNTISQCLVPWEILYRGKYWNIILI